MKIHPIIFAVLFVAGALLTFDASSVRSQEEYDPNEQNYGQDEGPGQEESPEEIREARHKHVLRILNSAYKAAWDEINKFDSGERAQAFKATEAADKAFADSKWSDPKLREEKDKARAKWEEADRHYRELRGKLIEAEFAASHEYYQLPESLRRVLENPLNRTPTFSGLPNADKLREAYEYVLKEAEEDQKQAAEDERERKAEEQRRHREKQNLPAEGEHERVGELKSVRVGMLVANGSASGELASASMVTDPDDYDGIPELTVVKAAVPLPHNRHGKALLQGVVVRPAQQTPQTASEAVTYRVPDASSLRFAIVDAESATTLGEITVPIHREVLPRGRATKFTMSPLAPPGGVYRVDGPFQGKASETHVAVNRKDARLLAETRNTAFFQPEEELRDGPNQVTVGEGSRTASLRVVKPKIDMQSSRRVLQENDTADVTVRVSRLDEIPDAAWKTGPSGQGGKLLLTIKNDSPDVVTMEGAISDTMTVALGRDDIRNGAYEKKLTVKALKAGTFALETSLDSDLARLPGNEGPIQFAEARETPTPAPEPNRGAKLTERSRSKEPSGESPVEEGETPEGGTVFEGGGPISFGDEDKPPINVPPANPPPQLHGNEEKNVDCPQRKLGCAALIIDFIQVDQDDNEDAKKDRLEEKKVIDDLGKNLKAAKCDVDEIVAKFEKVDKVNANVVKRETIDGRTNRPILHVELKGESDKTREAEKHNLEERKKIEAKIEDHRKKVRLGKEIAIELVNGHGSPGAPDKKSACGNWGPGLEFGYYTPQEKSLSNDSTDYEEPLSALWRDEFHEGNYQAAQGNVCDWVVYDMSCYSGLTPKAIDELENHGASSKLTCAQPSIVDCSLHAGWEFDFGSGTSICVKTAKAFQDLEALKDLNKVVDGATSPADLADRLHKAGDESQRIHTSLKEAKIEEGWSFYSDKGYKKDPDPKPPPEHPHTGY